MGASTDFLVIELRGLLRLDGSIFSPLSLSSINRPAVIEMSAKETTSFSELAFTAFFREHPLHYVKWYIENGNLTCDCESFWMVDSHHKNFFRKRFLGAPLYCQGSEITIWEKDAYDFYDCEKL